MSENTTGQYSKNSIPKEELRVFEKYIRAHPEYYDTEYIRGIYDKQGLKLFLDPFANDLLEPAKEALLKQRPFSAVRIGDGEANFLAFGAYEGTPNMDRYAFAATITNQKDSFRVDETWMLVLRELMRHAVLSADIVGVLGLWWSRPIKASRWTLWLAIFTRCRPRRVRG